jgi:hypothetical protein
VPFIVIPEPAIVTSPVPALKRSTLSPSLNVAEVEIVIFMSEELFATISLARSVETKVLLDVTVLKVELNPALGAPACKSVTVIDYLMII